MPRIRVQKWDMLRTKCWNIRFAGFGFQFNRAYEVDLSGQYIGVNCCIELPWKPWRVRFSIPSINTIESILLSNKSSLRSKIHLYKHVIKN